jgi:hypothetical protein
MQTRLQPLPSYSVITSSDSWCHVYSQRYNNCSRRTQCDVVAHKKDNISSVVCFCCYRRAKNKLQKQQRLLREVVIPSGQRTISPLVIKEHIIVFDGGNMGCPPITPPKSTKWRCHHVSELHVPDEVSGDIGLTFPRIDGCPPFILCTHYGTRHARNHLSSR